MPLLAAAARPALTSVSLALPACQHQCVTGTVSVARAVQLPVVCACGWVCLQAAPNLQYFSKGASAGARLFAVINRQPAIDAGRSLACGPDHVLPCCCKSNLFCCASAFEAASAWLSWREAEQRAQCLCAWCVRACVCVCAKHVCVPLLCLLLLHLAEDPMGEEPAECVGELRLEHVSFRYPARPDVMVMRDFCLEVKAGARGHRAPACLLPAFLQWSPSL